MTWATWVLALVILGIALVRGTFSGTVAVALIALAMLGALLPPVGLTVAAIVAFYLVLVHGVQIFGQLSKLFTAPTGGATS